MTINARGRFGSFVNLGMWVGLCGFSNLLNAGWHRNLKNANWGLLDYLGSAEKLRQSNL
tara:strand:+ start:20080 stop:20256 length:177 start_codon:yes stop_codon:yes gene_type:complete